MTKTVSLALLIAFAMLFAVTKGSTTANADGFNWASLTNGAQTASRADSPDIASSEDAPRKGNSFVRALGAPFRALGRLFGGRQKNAGETRHITQKEAAKFESAKILRVTDARKDPEPPSVPTVVASSTLDPHLQAGRALMNTGDLNGAIAELALAASSDSKSGEAQNLLGVAYETKGLRERALESFHAAVQANKSNPTFLNNYGYLLYKNNNFDGAKKYLKRATKLAPSDPRIWNNLALVQCQQGMFDEGYTSFVHAVGEYDGRMNMAAQLQRLGHAQEAIKHLEKAYALHPESSDVLVKLVSLYDMTGRISDAENARKSILALRTFADAK